MTDVTSTEALRAVYPQPNDLAVRKELSFIDRHAREFIARSPFVVIATSDAGGWPDASPRGDAPGFVEVPDEHRLLLPDRPGNNRLDSFQNLMANPKIALIFLVPRRLETLRVNGTARLLTDPEICQRLSVRGKPARSVVEVTATSVYFQCGKSVVRSGLWQPERWPSIDGMATFAEALADQIEGVNATAAEENLAAAYRDRLY
jgi:PPOX class probable FMN-dependent enzyme